MNDHQCHGNSVPNFLKLIKNFKQKRDLGKFNSDQPFLQKYTQMIICIIIINCIKKHNQFAKLDKPF